MTMVPISFDGDEILCVRREDGTVWVGVMRVCRSLGIDIKRQREKLAREPWAKTEFMPFVAPNGVEHRTLVIDLESLPMWLASIAATRVSEAYRGKLRRYQMECAKVLADHFFGRRTTGLRHPWSIRFSETSAPHLRYVNVHFQPGSWSVVTAAAVHMLVLEDEIIRHMMEPSDSDRPDVSVGLCWANERRRRGLGDPLGYAPIELPGRPEPVEASVYPITERPAFEEWFNNVYLREKLLAYLERKPEFGVRHGDLPCASTAERTCLALIGQPAKLKAKQRVALAAAGGLIPAGRPLTIRSALPLFDPDE